MSRRGLLRCRCRVAASYGWVIVWAGFVLLMVSSGITYSTPVLFRFFEADFGIGRGQAAFIFSFSQLMTFVIGPIAARSPRNAARASW